MLNARLLDEMLQSSDHQAAARAMEALLRMSKLDVEQLQSAFEGTPVT